MQKYHKTVKNISRNYGNFLEFFVKKINTHRGSDSKERGAYSTGNSRK